MGKITPKLLHDLSIRLSICDDKTVSGNIRGFGVDPHLPELLRGKIDKRLLRMYSDRLRMAVIFRITHDLNSRHFPVNFTSDIDPVHPGLIFCATFPSRGDDNDVLRVVPLLMPAKSYPAIMVFRQDQRTTSRHHLKTSKIENMTRCRPRLCLKYPSFPKYTFLSAVLVQLNEVVYRLKPSHCIPGKNGG